MGNTDHVHITISGWKPKSNRDKNSKGIYRPNERPSGDALSKGYQLGRSS
jgi:hypothetical protein